MNLRIFSSKRSVLKFVFWRPGFITEVYSFQSSPCELVILSPTREAITLQEIFFWLPDFAKTSSRFSMSLRNSKRIIKIFQRPANQILTAPYFSNGARSQRSYISHLDPCQTTDPSDFGRWVLQVYFWESCLECAQLDTARSQEARRRSQRKR